MDGQELIHVNLQLPAAALDSLARLTEQLRLLTESPGRRDRSAGEMVQERGENSAFDPEQFSALRQAALDGAPAPAAAVRGEVLEDPDVPEGAGHGTAPYLEDPAQAGSPPGGEPDDVEAMAAEVRAELDAQAVRRELAEAPEEIPAARAGETRQVPDPQAVGADAESRVPEGDAAWEQMDLWEYAAPVVRTEVRSGAETPDGAGLVVGSGPDAPQSRWAGVREEPAAAGASPVTAESISMALQRDGRRYDAGFPLY